MSPRRCSMRSFGATAYSRRWRRCRPMTRSRPPSDRSPLLRRDENQREEPMSDDRENRVALVTGGLRGLGRAMSLGLAKAGHPVVAVGHIESDVAEIAGEAEKLGAGKRFHPLVADLREKSECDRVVAASRERVGRVDI